MFAFIDHGNHGVPLLFFEPKNFTQWFKQQSAFTQNWVQQLGYAPKDDVADKKGAFSIPSDNGDVAAVIAVVASLDDPWIAGELPKSLPKLTYQLSLPELFANTDDKAQQEQRLHRVALSWGLGAYHFDRFCTESKSFPRLVIDDAERVTAAHHWLRAIYTVRHLVNTPANAMMPEDLALTVEQMADEFQAEFTQIIGDDLIAQNFPSVHAVGRASHHAPRLIELKWGNPDHPKLALVGKGVCFDSGGLDLKPASGMRLMKKDMGGAAHVIGLAHAIMAFNLPIHLHMIIPAVENAVSANAFRPGDILNSRKGLQVEIDNTDAEGRLILSDALTLACENKPDWVIDFATLTGACRVALGTEMPGFFTNRSECHSALSQAGEQHGDPIWPMPLHQPYKSLIRSQIADLSNSAPTPFGGAITAALFLEHFIEPETPWIHFDVMAWNQREQVGRPVGGEAMGIQAVFYWLMEELCNR